MNRELLTKLAVHYVAPLVTMPPTSVFISPTLRCSSRCAHCGVWRGDSKVPEMTPSEWAELLGDPFLRRVGVLWLSGGEPTLRTDLSEIALRASESLPGLKSVTVATNALHPFRLEGYLEDTVATFEKHGIYTWIHFSLDGPAEIHDRVRGVEGAFNSLERCVTILRRLKESGTNIGWGFNCVISALNASYLSGAEDAARDLGGEITFNLAMPVGGFYRGDDSNLPTARDRVAIRSFIGSLMDRANPYYRRHYETLLEVLSGKPRRRRCETLEATLYIDPDGSVYPCPACYDEIRLRMYPGDVRGAWERLARYRGWVRRGLCRNCALGCSFGEGISLGEFIKLATEGYFET